MLSLLVVFFIGNNDYSNKTQMAMSNSKMPPTYPASQQGPPALVSAHITQIGRPCHKGAAAVMMRIAKLPRKVEQAPLYEIESACNAEKKVP